MWRLRRDFESICKNCVKKDYNRMKITKRNEQRLFMCGYVTYVTLLHTRTHAHTYKVRKMLISAYYRALCE